MKLKPCPFCGGEVKEVKLEDRGYLTICCVVGSMISVEEWNTRPIEDALQKRIAELEHDISELEQADDESDRLIGDYKYRVERLLHLEQPRWIPVSERLPEDKNSWLIFFEKENGAYPGSYFNGDWYGSDGEIIPSSNVTHWMPLPEPPEVE
jgi:hypothetical protein